MRPNEAVIKVVLAIIEQLGGLAITTTNAFPGVMTAAREYATGTWSSFDTDSRQGAEFSFLFWGHLERVLKERARAPNHTLSDEFIVLAHFI